MGVEQTQGDRVSGDKNVITVGDVNATVAAIGVGAKVIYNNVERALSSVEVSEQALDFERRRLAEAVKDYVLRLERQAQPASLDLASPYKSLHEYDIDDAAVFYGRSAAIRALMGNLERDQLTVLHADSGAGKTSLVKAGIVPRLLADGAFPLYVRPYNVPVHFAVKRALLPQLEQTPNLAIASLYDFLRQVTDLLGGERLVILLDQFEEIFTVQSAHARADFVAEIAPCLQDDLLPVRWIFSMRTEWFGQLGTFRPDVRQPFANEFLLQPLKPEEAREIITEPAATQGVTYEPGLVDRLVADLGGEAIQPPQLQLVCSALYEALGPDDKVITAAMYEEAGQTRGILRSHLDRVIKRQVPADQRGAAKMVLQALITSDGRRVLRTRADIAEELALRDVERAVVNSVLNTLLDGRLLRTAELGEEEGQLGFELAHDYLLERIELDEGEQARKAAEELLHREAETYRQHGTLLSADELAIVELHLDSIRVSDEERELIEKSQQQLARQRARFVASVGGVVLLVAVAVVMAIIAIGATRTASEATDQINISQVTLDAQQTLSIQEQAELDAAQAARTEAEDAAAAAAAAEAAAAAAAEQAAGQLEEAEEELIRIFEDTGVVGVANGPVTVTWDGAYAWTVGANVDIVQRVDPVLGAVDRTWGVGSRPVALAWDGTRMWVANRDDDTIQWMDPETLAISEPFPVGDKPVALAWEPERGILWIAAETDGTVQQFDPERGEVVSSVNVGDLPVALAWDGTHMWVASQGGPSIQRVDPELAAVTATIDGIDDGPFALLYQDGVLWSANYDANTVQRIDAETASITATIPVGTRPRALTYDGVSLWIALENDSTLQQIDPLANEVILTQQMEAGPFDLTWNGESLWVAIADTNRIQRIEPEVSAIDQIILVGDRPLPVVYDATLAGLWVGNTRDNTVMFVDPADASVETVAVGGFPGNLLLAEGSLWVANASDNTIQQISTEGRFVQNEITVGTSPGAMAWDGSSLWVAITGDNRLQRLDVTAGAVTEAVVVGSEPADLLWIEARGELWVANAGDGTLQAYTPETGTLSDPIAVGSDPSALEWDGSSIWVANRGDNTLMRIDPDSGAVLAAVEVATSPADVLWDGQNLWAVGAGLGIVQLIDTTNHVVLASVPVRTFSQALTWDGESLWVSNFLGDTVQQLNARAIVAIGEARR